MKFFPKAKKTDREKGEDNEPIPAKEEAITLQQKSDNKTEDSSKNADFTKKRSFGFTSNLLKQKNSDKKLETVTHTKIEESNKSQSSEEDAKEEQKILLDDNVKTGQSKSLAVEQITTEKISKLIELVSTGKDSAIIPVINFEENKISYPILAQIGENENDISFLEKLASSEFDIFEKAVYDRLVVCPEHKEYFAVTLRLYCSSCNSLDLLKLQLLEHKTCGFIGERKEFGILSDNDIITKCPGCERTIKDMQKEIHKLGMWYQCNGCNTKLDNPIMKLRCRKFEHDFDINQSGTVLVPYYKTKKESKTISKYLISIAPQIKRLLVSYGLTVHDSSSAKGKSGVLHQVSIFADDQKGKTIIIDIKGSETEFEDTMMDSMLSKVLDISPSIAIFVAIPSVSDRAKAMATALNISVISGRNFADIVAGVDATLKRRLSQQDIPKI